MAIQQSKETRVTLTALVRILDWACISQEATDLGAAPDALPAEQVALVTMETPSLPGLALVTAPEASVYHGPEGECWSVSATFQVRDVPALIQKAKEQTSAVWLDEELTDSVQTVDAALYEVCCASNSRISPVDLGFEYLSSAVVPA